MCVFGEEWQKEAGKTPFCSGETSMETGKKVEKVDLTKMGVAICAKRWYYMQVASAPQGAAVKRKHKTEATKARGGKATG